MLEQVKTTLAAHNIPAHVPTMEWDAISVYADFSQDKKLKENANLFGDFRRRAYEHRIKQEKIKEDPAGFLYLSKMSKSRIMNIYKKELPINVIYSQWLGYLQLKNTDYFGAEEMASYRDDPQVNFVYAHTSGHATVKDLEDFANALKPKQLIPIHTEYSGKFKEIFNNVVEIEDGKSFYL